MNRLSLLFQHLPASSTQLTRKFLLMLVGLFRTYLMEAMTKFKQWLKLVSALGSWSFFCVYFMFEFVWLLLLHSSVMLIVVYFICFRYPSPAVLIPALRTVGNIVTGDDVQTQVVDLPVLNSLIVLALLWSVIYYHAWWISGFYVLHGISAIGILMVTRCNRILS